MALNKYMHPRNIYKNPPDFEKLSNTYPEFAKVAKTDVTGKKLINFKDPHSLRVLTKCLLKSDFDLDVEIPEDRLVPTLPLRLNYILWIEDLMAAIQRNSDICGIDIGTGACAVYLLLAGKKNKWHMLGTETDHVSLKHAQDNINRNNLQNLLEVTKNEDKTLVQHLFEGNNNKTFDFCMCNPPFYSNIQELCESRSPARLPPKNAFTGSPQELITEGGELEFCRKLIKESKNCSNSILIFTTMVGHKYTLSELLQDLKSDNIKHTHTEFCQGRVTRWGLAWTYQNFDLYKLVPPRDKPRKKSTPITYQLPRLENCEYNIDTVYNKIKTILQNLNIKHKVISKRGNVIELDIIANGNTWSNQRRRKRQLKRMEMECKKKRLESEQEKGNTNETTTNESSILKDNSELENNTPTSQVDTQNEPLTHALLKLFMKNDIFLEMEFLTGTGGKESVHQIIQYIKNNWL